MTPLEWVLFPVVAVAGLVQAVRQWRVVRREEGEPREYLEALAWVAFPVVILKVMWDMPWLGQLVFTSVVTFVVAVVYPRARKQRMLAEAREQAELERERLLSISRIERGEGA